MDPAGELQFEILRSDHKLIRCAICYEPCANSCVVCHHCGHLRKLQQDHCREERSPRILRSNAYDPLGATVPIARELRAVAFPGFRRCALSFARPLPQVLLGPGDQMAARGRSLWELSDLHAGSVDEDCANSARSVPGLRTAGHPLWSGPPVAGLLDRSDCGRRAPLFPIHQEEKQAPSIPHRLSH